jgi:hypothetical protein
MTGVGDKKGWSSPDAPMLSHPGYGRAVSGGVAEQDVKTDHFI